MIPEPYPVDIEIIHVGPKKGLHISRSVDDTGRYIASIPDVVKGSDGVRCLGESKLVLAVDPHHADFIKHNLSSVIENLDLKRVPAYIQDNQDSYTRPVEFSTTKEYPFLRDFLPSAKERQDDYNSWKNSHSKWI